MSKTLQRALALTAAVALVGLYLFLLAGLYLANRDRGYAGVNIAVTDHWRKTTPAERRLEVVNFSDRSPAARAGLREGDLVRSIDGVVITEKERLAASAKAKRPGDRVVFGIERDERRLLIPVVIESMFPTGILLHHGLETLLSLAAFLVIGLVVFWKKSDRQATVLFAMTLVAAAQFVISDIVSILGRFGKQGLQQPGQSIYMRTGERSVVLASWLEARHFLLLIVSVILFVLLITMLLHLSLIFPRERPIVRRQPNIIRFLYLFPLFLFLSLSTTTFQSVVANSPLHDVQWLAAPPAILFGFAALAFVRRKERSWKETIVEHPWLFFAAMLLLELTSVAAVGVRLPYKALTALMVIAGGTIVIVTALTALAIAPVYAFATIRSLRRNYGESTVDEKRQVKWPLWGTIVAVGSTSFLIFLSVFLGFIEGLTRSLADRMGGDAWKTPAQLDRAISGIGDVLLPSLWILIPISFAIGILRYRLLDIDVIIRKTVVYSIVTVIVALIYFVLVGGFGTMLVHTAGIESQAVTVVSTLLLAALLIPLRNRVQSAVDRRFFRKKIDHPDSLRKLNQEIAAAASLEDAMRRAADRIQMTLQSRSVAIFTAPPQERFLAAIATVGVTETVAGRLRIDRSTEWLQNATVSVAPEDESLRKVSAEQIAPVRSHGRVSGVLAIGRSLSDADYDADDLAFLDAATETIAVGIDSLRMRDEEKEFATARGIQLGLLPKGMPNVEGLEIAGLWNPARVVGGDYYDVFTVAPNRVVLCIGDVAGKGIPAALLMSSLQASVRAIAPAGLSLADTVYRVKQVVAGNMTAGKFITFFFAAIDASARQITYVNAGHNAPILLHRDGAMRLERGGSALAHLFVSSPYEEETVALEPGDVLLLFTDGVTEARDPETSEDFGDERVVELLVASRDQSANEIQKRIVDAIERHTRGEVQDDVTMIVVRAV